MKTENLQKSLVFTPVGRMIAIASDKGLCFLEFDTPGRMGLIRKRVAKHFGPVRLHDGQNEFSHLTQKWLHIYFDSQCDPDVQIPLDTRGTVFEKKVWEAMEGIPFGATLSYKEIARKIGNPKGSRAVGGASRRNPVAIIVPCHRVVGSSGSLTGYGGGLDTKAFLLTHESAI